MWYWYEMESNDLYKPSKLIVSYDDEEHNGRRIILHHHIMDMHIYVHDVITEIIEVKNMLMQFRRIINVSRYL